MCILWKWSRLIIIAESWSIYCTITDHAMHCTQWTLRRSNINSSNLVGIYVSKFLLMDPHMWPQGWVRLTYSPISTDMRTYVRWDARPGPGILRPAPENFWEDPGHPWMSTRRHQTPPAQFRTPKIGSRTSSKFPGSFLCQISPFCGNDGKKKVGVGSKISHFYHSTSHNQFTSIAPWLNFDGPNDFISRIHFCLGLKF